MNNRILSIVATVTLLSLTSGCGVLRQFWFGRGARCGNNAAVTPIRPLANCRNRLHGNVVAPPQTPYQGIPQQAVTAPRAPCNCNPYLGGTVQPGYNAEPGCGWERGCGIEHGCGVESYGGVINDPYLSGGIVGDGVVIDGQYPGSTVPGTIMPDNFVPAESRSYKVDTDGARILSEAPLPPGATPVN